MLGEKTKNNEKNKVMKRKYTFFYKKACLITQKC